MATGLNHTQGLPSRKRTNRTGQRGGMGNIARDGSRFGGTWRSPSSGKGRARQHDVLAALDLGTNNCRLLVARPVREGFRVIDAFSRIVRLGEGVAGSGQLSEEAIERTIDALRVCCGKMRRRGVTRFRAVATEACRKADNGADFLLLAAGEAGIELEVITPKEEAQLAFAGCLPLLDPEIDGALVFDIGGGSTELAWTPRSGSDGREQIEVFSVPLGVVNLAEKYGGDSYGGGVYERMVEAVVEQLLPFDQEFQISKSIERGELQMVGTSGTVTTLGGLKLDLQRYVRDQVDGMFLDVVETLDMGRELASMDFNERASQPCIGKERADLVVAGCAILEAICRIWGVERLRVADRGVREGILLGLLNGES